jgi:hypothetical protein
MGLDMYLNAHQYVSPYGNEELYAKLNAIKEMPTLRAKGISYEAIYWRKANAIHQWFINNVQKGVDDCGEYTVTRQALDCLMQVCGKVNTDHKCAKLYLPVADGFFFGSQVYDEDYFLEIQRTEHMLNLLLHEADDDSWTFTYRASW